MKPCVTWFDFGASLGNGDKTRQHLQRFLLRHGRKHSGTTCRLSNDYIPPNRSRFRTMSMPKVTRKGD